MDVYIEAHLRMHSYKIPLLDIKLVWKNNL